ncbi:MAG: bifunctional nuclease family protein [Deltaproteobacteria bacterium]|nr:bifunctional nuclease family protein [Deltaproteobacteria bacterium]MBI3389167.1 bifunctional nuclease family protein [Deltaproteobacteria bacterium]
MTPHCSSLRLLTVAALGGALLTGCRASEPTEVEVEVRSVGMDHASGAPVVVLQDKAAHQTALPIWVGPAEAQAIAMQLEGVTPPRPMTHDLMKLALEQSGVEFEKVVIQALKESTYYARIFLHSGRKPVELDSRPSDAIALAMRFHKPIFVARTLMESNDAVDLRREAARAGALTLAGVTLQNLSEELASHFGMRAGEGVLVSNVADDARTLLRRGDVIVEANGDRVGDVADLRAKLDGVQPGGRTDLAVQRGDQRVHVEFATE